MKFATKMTCCLVLFLFLAGNISNAASLHYTYDDRNRLITVENPGKYRIEYSYDPADNRISRRIQLSDISFDSDHDGDVDGQDLTDFAGSWDGDSDTLAQFAIAFGSN